MASSPGSIPSGSGEPGEHADASIPSETWRSGAPTTRAPPSVSTMSPSSASSKRAAMRRAFAATARDLRGVAVPDLDVAGSKPKLVGDDLGQYGGGALAVRRGPGDEQRLAG